MMVREPSRTTTEDTFHVSSVKYIIICLSICFNIFTHRENKAHMNLGSGHLFLLAQVQKQLVLQKWRGVLLLKIKSQTSNLKQVTS